MTNTGRSTERITHKPLFCFALLWVFSCTPALACEPWIARVESIDHTLEIKSPSNPEWRTADIGATLCSGDRLRVTGGRAALRLYNSTVLRINTDTQLEFRDPNAQQSWIDLLKGAMYFITHTPQRFGVETPYLNAFVEGTEFAVILDSAQQASTVQVYAGSVVAGNALGKTTLSSGQAASATAQQAPSVYPVAQLRDSLQWALYYPPIISHPLMAEPLSLGDIKSAQQALESAPSAEQNIDYWLARAALALYTGQVNTAQNLLQQVLQQSANNSAALALQAMIAIVQNELDRAADLLAQAEQHIVLSGPQQPEYAIAVYLAQSYLAQAQFQLQHALDSVAQALVLGQDAEQYQHALALAWARYAELWLMLGNSKYALQAAQRAQQLQPKLSRTETVLGFVQLNRYQFSAAKRAFLAARELDSNDPLPILGLGLIDIRKNRLTEGREHLELATTLAPEQSLLRSYLGKAYFAEQRNALANAEFELAKQLDAMDPTPWFYQAILLQANNAPFAALQSLQRSIDLNDNRAVYRSRLLLDRDQTARSASQAAIYRDLGFTALATQAASQALNTSPSEHGGHQLLAQTYANEQRFDVARSSEILQAQLLQPLTATPVQAMLAERDLLLIQNTGPANMGFNEYNPLFDRERSHVQLGIMLGNNNTQVGNGLVSGLHGRVAYAIEAYDYQTDGYRENNDLDLQLMTAFTQFQITPDVNLQLQAHRREEQRGDIEQRILAGTDRLNRREQNDRDSLRLGLHYAPTVNINLIASFESSDEEFQQSDQHSDPFVTIDTMLNSNSESAHAETQIIVENQTANWVAGIEAAEIDLDSRLLTELSSNLPIPLLNPIETINKGTTEYQTVYGYWQQRFIQRIDVSFGASYADLDAVQFNDDIDQWNPALGLNWRIKQGLNLRAAGYRTLKRPKQTEQTLEPTQIVGFNKFFDEFDGTNSENYGLGLDYQANQHWWLGIERLERDLESQQTSFGLIQESEETRQMLYLYWSNTLFSVNVHYFYENMERQAITDFIVTDRPIKLKTESLPIEFRYHQRNGFSFMIKPSYVRQDAWFESPLLSTSGIVKADEDFWLLDIAASYSFWNKKGKASLDILNALDEDFRFQDNNFQDNSPQPVVYVPERSVFARLSLFF